MQDTVGYGLFPALVAQSWVRSDLDLNFGLAVRGQNLENHRKNGKLTGDRSVVWEPPTPSFPVKATLDSSRVDHLESADQVQAGDTGLSAGPYRVEPIADLSARLWAVPTDADRGCGNGRSGDAEPEPRHQ